MDTGSPWPALSLTCSAESRKPPWAWSLRVGRRVVWTGDGMVLCQLLIRPQRSPAHGARNRDVVKRASHPVSQPARTRKHRLRTHVRHDPSYHAIFDMTIVRTTLLYSALGVRRIRRISAAVGHHLSSGSRLWTSCDLDVPHHNRVAVVRDQDIQAGVPQHSHQRIRRSYARGGERHDLLPRQDIRAVGQSEPS